MRKKTLIYFCFLLISCGTHNNEKREYSSIDSTVDCCDTTDYIALSVDEMMGTKEEEDKFLKTLLPDLYSRSFPTDEEMKMWYMIFENGKSFSDLPLLGRALVRAYLGYQFYEGEGGPEADLEKAAILPASGDFYSTGDLAMYILEPYHIEASSFSNNNGIKYDVSNIIGSGLYKPWCSADGKTEGETITCDFKLENRPIDSIFFVNGYCHTEKQWRNHGRVAELQLLVDGKPLKTINVADTPRNQILDLDFPISPNPNNESVQLTLKVLKTYSGDKYNDVSISLISFTSDTAYSY